MNQATFENITTALIVIGLLLVTGLLWGIVILMRNSLYEYIPPVVIIIGLLTVSVYWVSKWKWKENPEEQ